MDMSEIIPILVLGSEISLLLPTDMEFLRLLLVFGTNPRSNDSLLNLLFNDGCIDEESVPENVIIEGNDNRKFSQRNFSLYLILSCSFIPENSSDVIFKNIISLKINFNTIFFQFF